MVPNISSTIPIPARVAGSFQGNFRFSSWFSRLPFQRFPLMIRVVSAAAIITMARIRNIGAIALNVLAMFTSRMSARSFVVPIVRISPLFAAAAWRLAPPRRWRG